MNLFHESNAAARFIVCQEFGKSTRFEVLNNGNVTAAGSAEFAGDISPLTDGGCSLGSASKRFANVYTQDMHFSNEGSEGNSIDGTTGNWTLQEGEENLYFINNKTGMKFRVVMESVD